MPATTNVEAGQTSATQVDRVALEARLVRELDGGRAALPILPQVAAQAIRFANDPNSNLRKLAELIEADPSIAARFVAVANSMNDSRAVPGSSTRLAIIRLGLEGTRDLLFQVVYASFTHGLPRYRDLVARSFRRSVMCAIAARLVSDKMRFCFEYDYLCGLLHDIGEARIYRILADYKEPIEMPVLEDFVKRYHRRAGAELAIAWGLPEPIIETCALHHDDPAKASGLVKMVMMSDIVVALIERRQVAAGSATLREEAAKPPVPAAIPVSPATTDGTPSATDSDDALGPTSAVWPTSFTDPPGAPDSESATWAIEGKGAKVEAKVPSAPAAVWPAAHEASASQPTVSTPSSSGSLPVDLDAADFAKLEALGMSRELAEMLLTKLDESLVDLPL